MPSLNFQKQFAAAVESGEKRQTIRATRKRPFRAGDTLHLFTGMRTKGCRKLGEVRCTSVEHVQIDGIEGYDGVWRDAEIRVANRPVDSLDAFAADDGFESGLSMFRWFRDTHGIPFEGQLIRWDVRVMGNLNPSTK